jgi:peptidyl-prolyl cis-trans isomerase A (cyclophilin A)
MAEETYAVLKTNLGDITIQLFPNHAPKTVRNFVELAEGTREYTDPNTGKPGSGPYFDGTIFHRIIPGFMIQGGDPLGQGFGGPGYTFDDEIHPDLRFDRKYLLAMANAGLRGGRGTNGSQFFITVSTPAHLNGKHTIFGEVVDEESKKVIDTIAAVRTGAQDRPVEPIVIQSVVIERRQA